MTAGRIEQHFIGGNLFNRVEILERQAEELGRRGDVAARGYFVDGWRRTNVAAGLSASIVDRFGSAADSAFIPAVKIRLTGFMAAINASRSGGDMVVAVYLDSQAALEGYINASVSRYLNVAAEGIDIMPGVSVTFRLTTTGSWAPTSADLTAGFWFEL